MRIRTLACALLLASPIAALHGAADAPEKAKPGDNVHLTAGPALSAAMREAVLRADGAFFTAFFDTCDVDKVAGMVTDDFEFFHDKGGRISTSGAQFVQTMRDKCARQRTGEDFLSRRELVVETAEVYPLDNYGAVETGEHRFYAVIEGQPDRLTETGTFAHVWKDDGGVWKLSRVLSYNHRLADPADAGR